MVEPIGLEKIFIDVTIQSANYLSMLDFLSEMDKLKRIYYVQSFTFEGIRENETREGPMEDMLTYSIQFYAYFAPLVQLDIPLPTPSSGQPSDKVNPIIDAEETVESDNSSTETISDSTVLQEASKENLPTEDAQTSSSNANQSNQHAVTTPVEKPIKTHVVQSGETLYSISMKFYGNRNGEEIIKTANNLSGNTVRTGQVLRIP
ncbi:LysM peptidoglycan-binding domain-containing protein [Paenisporosarcina cavernae]|uniref:LysM peptidoglycan-binding domain-containing protein n=2 Tax=Paenisporosarcina cavernae TaxID=2320858 RepID=A0A385YXY9_9BACL|nr:LysM peptidoglycan-binding domain-containing protein [Paenisporosarcina cavernae]